MPERPIISVTYSKQVSDGDYGHEGAEVTLSDFLPDDETSEVDVASRLLTEARALVYRKLDESPSQYVRRALRTVDHG